MFGQPQNKGFAFGAGGAGTFGTASTASPFGGGATFGAAATGGGFGAQSAVSKPLFGAGTQQQTSTPGLFGAMTGATGAATGNVFGQPAASTSSGFGLGQPAVSTTGGGLFSAAPTSSFGFQTGTGLGAGTGLFGGAATLGAAPAAASASTGLFGATAAAPTATATTGLFGGGGGTAGGLFGGSAPTTGGAFGAAASGGFAAMQQGTTTKFEATPGNDSMMKNGVNTTVQTKHQCITAMKVYENKSLEELRMEDYSVGRKGPQPGTAGATTLFGGTQVQPLQQAQTQAQAGFGFQSGAGTPSGFTAGGTGLLFGQPTASSSGQTLFGPAAPVSSQPSVAFGAPTSQSLFNNQSQPTLFGGTNTFNKTLFGQPTTTAPANVFGANTTASPGFATAFGAPNAGATAGLGMLSASATKQPFALGPTTSTTSSFPTFNAATPSGSGLFGTNLPAQTGGSIFGQGTATSTPATSFGFPVATSAAPTLFGSLTQQSQQQQQSKPFGFGTTTFPTSGMTMAGGTALPVSSGTSNTMFGNLGAFGAQQQPSVATALNADATRDAAMQQQLQTHMMALTNSPYGDSPLFRSLSKERADKSAAKLPTDPSALKAVLSSSQLKVNSRPLNKLTPRPLLSSPASLGSGKKGELFDGFDEDSSFGNDFFVPRRSVKKLTVRDVVSSSSSRPSSLAGGSVRGDDDFLSPANSLTADGTTRKRLINDGPRSKEYETLSLGLSPREMEEPLALGLSPRPGLVDSVNGYEGIHPDDSIVNLNIKSKQKVPASTTGLAVNHDTSLDGNSTPDRDEESPSEAPAHPAGIKLTRSDYFTIPSLDELSKQVDDNGDCFVRDFTVGRKGYGSVFFPGVTNVAGLDLDEIVHFRRKEVTVYPDDDAKPPHGSGLNKKAEVTLHCVWPIDKSTQSPIKNAERLKGIGYQDKVELATVKIGAKFIDYRPETGSWVFEVKHFSKYGLPDESDEEEAGSTGDPKKLGVLQQQNLKVPAGDKTSAVKAPVIVQQQQLLSQQTSISSSSDDDHSNEKESLDSEAAAAVGTLRDTSAFLPDDEVSGRDAASSIPASRRIAGALGVHVESIQRMKASFFDGNEDDDIGEMDWNTDTADVTKAKIIKTEDTKAFVASSTRPPLSSVLRASAGIDGANISTGEMSNFIKSKTGAAVALAPRAVSPELGHYPLLASGSGDAGTDSSHRRPGPAGSAVAAAAAAALTGAYAVPYQDSLLTKANVCVIDAATFMGRRCRVGWGPGGVMVHGGAPIGRASDNRGADDARWQLPAGFSSTSEAGLAQECRRVVIEQIHARSCNKSEILQACETSALRIQQGHCVPKRDSGEADGLPVLSAVDGVSALHAYAAQSLNDVESCSTDDPSLGTLRHWVNVWELCVALWGQLSDLPLQNFAGENNAIALPYEEQHARREAFSRWLAYAASETHAVGVETSRRSKADGSARVFAKLAEGSIIGACREAVASGDHRLALLLAQAGTTQPVRQLLRRQLSDWRDSETDRFIAEDRLKIYALLAGHMLWPTSAGNLVNVCEDLDWKRALAVHFWYSIPAPAGLKSAVDAYDVASGGSSARPTDVGEVETRLANSGDSYAAPPLPPYLEVRGAAIGAADTDARDTCYHIMKLYCDRAYRIDRILNPLTWTDDPLDYQLSWHLMSVLEALGYRSLLTDDCRMAVHVRYADQLEAAGQWQWAAFVLLHIEDAHRRSGAIRALLSRHIMLDSEQRSKDYLAKELFLTQQLGVPIKFVHEAKAARAQRLQRYGELCVHQIESGQLSAAHETLVQHVAPTLVANEDHVTLGTLLKRIRECGEVVGWDNGGRIYQDYVSVLTAVEQMSQRGCSSGELHRLHLDVVSLARRLGNLRCPTARHRLSQAEMAKRVAVLLRTLVSSQAASSRGTADTDSTSTAKLLAPVLSLLPLPEDYSLQELRSLVSAYCIEFAT